MQGKVGRRGVAFGIAAALAWPGLPRQALADGARPDAAEVLQTWYRLVLELVRHTPTYSPPVASRAFAYLGITAHEVMVQGDPALRTLAGQLNGLDPVPAASVPRDVPVALHAAMAGAVAGYFGNTGPTGQRAMAAMRERLGEKAGAGVADAVLRESRACGEAVGAHILDWSAGDGGAVIRNMGFPLTYTPQDGPEHWVPTSQIAQQQAPLLPDWGNNRTFAAPDGTACALDAPPVYSEEPGSEFHAQAMEVYEVANGLTPEQRAIARFWSDDPMLSLTPPGHWISIAMQIMEREGADAARRAEVLALTGIAVADAFICCWKDKFRYDLLRPVTYIRRVIDPKWEPLLNTPPFPEYPSGHSVQSGAAEVVLTRLFGADHAFEDATHVDDGMPARGFPNFRTAAEEAGISRLYGGIHFRAAVDRGLEQGRCTGAFAAALKTRA